MAVIGIDLGTTNSLASYWKNGEVHLIADENGNTLFPSAVSYVDNEGLLVGQGAKERLVTHSHDTVCSFKRFMGTDKMYQLGHKNYTALELSAMVLERIKQNGEFFLKEEIEEAIITVPAYFNDKQRSDTKKAAKIAGLSVDRLINEPSAAALAYRMEYGEEDKTLLVFDFGGGTLDLSYVECFDNIIEIVAVAGDNYLGGDDIDSLIVQYFCQEHGLNLEILAANDRSILQKRAEEAKCRLEVEECTNISLEIEGKLYETLLNNDILFQVCIPLFTKIKELFIRILNDAKARVSDLDDLIMVGGSSRLSVVRRFLRELLGKEPVVLGDTDKVVALGAGCYTGIRRRNEDIKDMLLTDVCPFTLGVESWHRKTDMEGYMLPMIERNSTLPSSKIQRLVTLQDYQRGIVVRVYQGEEYYAKDNLFLGEISIPVEPKLAGEEWIDVYFTYDINGILYVEVVNSHNVRNHMWLSNQDLSEMELEKYKKEMEQLLIPPIQQEENRKLLEELESYYESSSSVWRKRIGIMIDRFVQGLNCGRQHLIKRTVEDTKKYLDTMKETMEHEEEWLFDGELKQDMEDVEELIMEEEIKIDRKEMPFNEFNLGDSWDTTNGQ